MTGFTGYGAIYNYTFVGESYYDALQTSLNKRLSRNLQYGVNYTWSKTITYYRHQWTPDSLNKNVATGSARPHAANFNFGYDLPYVKRFGNNEMTKTVVRRLADQRQWHHVLRPAAHHRLHRCQRAHRLLGPAPPPAAFRSAAPRAATSG